MSTETFIVNIKASNVPVVIKSLKQYAETLPQPGRLVIPGMTAVTDGDLTADGVLDQIAHFPTIGQITHLEILNSEPLEPVTVKITVEFTEQGYTTHNDIRFFGVFSWEAMLVDQWTLGEEKVLGFNFTVDVKDSEHALDNPSFIALHIPRDLACLISDRPFAGDSNPFDDMVTLVITPSSTGLQRHQVAYYNDEVFGLLKLIERWSLDNFTPKSNTHEQQRMLFTQLSSILNQPGVPVSNQMTCA